jgi:drug/metabolite transporter (DMT)-like permease
MSAIIFGLVAALSWSIHDLLVRRYAVQFGAIRLAFLVMIIGGALLAIPVLVRGQIFDASWRGIMFGLLMGLAYACAVGGLYKGFSLAPVSVVGPLTAGYPALVIVWGMVGGLQPSFGQWLAIGLILTGSVIVSRSSAGDGDEQAIPQRSSGFVFWQAWGFHRRLFWGKRPA